MGIRMLSVGLAGTGPEVNDAAVDGLAEGTVGGNCRGA